MAQWVVRRVTMKDQPESGVNPYPAIYVIEDRTAPGTFVTVTTANNTFDEQHDVETQMLALQTAGYTIADYTYPP